MKKVIDIEDRIPSMREKRRKTTNQKFLLIVSIFVIALLIILYFQSPFSRINQIAVKGANLHNQEYYKEKSGVIEDKPFWGFTKSSAEKSINEIETVKSVEISRKWLHDVEINITEWDTIGYIEENGDYSLLLTSGDMFSVDQLVPSEQAPILNGFTNSESRAKIVAQLKKMDKDVFKLISEIILMENENGTNDITVYMVDGFEVRAIIPTFAEKMAYYPAVTAQLHAHEKGVIDMEVGTYYTPFSKVYGEKEEVEQIDEESE